MISSLSDKLSTFAAAAVGKKKKNVLPGFGITIGFTVTYLCLILLLPLSMIIINTFKLSLKEFIDIVTSARVLASFRISFGASLMAALLNSVFGLIVAWVIVRYNFPGKKILDSLVDLPFALPTAVAGISLTAIFAGNGWIGSYLSKLGIQAVYNSIGIIIALTFIGLPFVVRTIQPVLQDLDRETEEAAASLCAPRWKIFTRVIFPEIKPALVTGFTLAFARALGEYGSVIFIAGNIPYRTEITPLLIMTKLEQYDYAGATAISAVMLLISFIILLLINVMQLWSRKYK